MVPLSGFNMKTRLHIVHNYIVFIVLTRANIGVFHFWPILSISVRLSDRSKVTQHKINIVKNWEEMDILPGWCFEGAIFAYRRYWPPFWLVLPQGGCGPLAACCRVSGRSRLRQVCLPVPQGSALPYEQKDTQD